MQSGSEMRCERMKRYRVLQCRSDATSGSDVDWSAAELLTDFSFPWAETVPPHTEFRALWNEDRLVFRFECTDEDIVLGTGENSTERVLGSDRAEIFLATDLTLQSYFGFEMAPSGEVHAYRAKHYRQFDREWSCDGFEFSAQREARRYFIEGSISMRALRELNILKPDAREFFAGVYRAEFTRKPDGSAHQGWMAWINPNTERPDFHVPESFGVFELV
jgi:hypothetical protein